MGRLERNKRVERDRAVLERILALLLALAVLADRAAGLPFLKRLPLLAMLGHGEAEARMLIIAMASGSPAEPACVLTGTVGDATRLAARFRMLAFTLSSLLAQVRREPPARQVLSPTGSPAREPRRLEGGHPLPSLPPPDTS
jgi:hypothetical protein